MGSVALSAQLHGIAHHGWRLQVDTRWLSRLLYCREPQDLTDPQAHELLMFLAKQGDPGELGAAIYDWEETGDLE
jgi:hypothetical protein